MNVKNWNGHLVCNCSGVSWEIGGSYRNVVFLWQDIWVRPALEWRVSIVRNLLTFSKGSLNVSIYVPIRYLMSIQYKMSFG